MTFADKVKMARATLMVSQEEFAKLLGVSRITVTRWESQGYTPKFLTSKKFEQFCEEHNICFEEKK